MLLPAPIGFDLMVDSDASIAVSPSIWGAPLSKPSRFARKWAQTHGAAIQESGASKEDLCFLAIETAAVERDGGWQWQNSRTVYGPPLRHHRSDAARERPLAACILGIIKC